nr:hypothetical protein [uncultured Psychroserpens sp.]
MKTVFKISRFINVLALICLIGGPWGIIVTGFLQVIAAVFFLIVFPKNTLIYIYFIVVGLFFLVWNHKLDTWLFVIPLSLIFYLTYIIHYSKSLKNHTHENYL